MADIFMSNTAREQSGLKPKVAPPAVSTTVKEKPMRRRVAEAFISSERGNIKDHVIFDVVIPAIKNAITDVISDGVSMLLYGEKSSVRKSKASKTPYGSFWASSIFEDSGRKAQASEESKRGSLSRYLDATWASKDDAQSVLDCMVTILESYPAVTVADFYSLLTDENGNPIFTIESVHSKWGWKSLSAVTPVKATNGQWGLSLPRPQRLD